MIRPSSFLIQDKKLTESMAEEKENKAHSKTATEFAVKNHLPFFLNTQVFLNSIFFTKSNVRSKFLLASLTSYLFLESL